MPRPSSDDGGGFLGLGVGPEFSLSDVGNVAESALDATVDVADAVTDNVVFKTVVFDKTACTGGSIASCAFEVATAIGPAKFGKVLKYGDDALAAVRGADEAADAAKTYSRPSGYRAGVRNEVWENAREASTGQVRDPLTGRLMSNSSPWDMGHLPGHEFRRHAADARARGITRQQFLDEHNDPLRYRPELPSSNRSHRGELLD